MKITKITAAGLRGGTPRGGWTNELRPSDCNHTLVSVHTDSGITGFGSASSPDAMVNGAIEVLSRFAIGENADEPERVSEILRQNMFWFGRGGPVEHTISAIDIALWDILGKSTGRSISRLLGGRYRDRVRPYASLLMDAPAVLQPELATLTGLGFGAFKIGWGPFGRKDSALDEAIVRAAREAIGPQRLLMVDAGGSDAFWMNGVKWAIRTADMLHAYDVTWFEEPLSPDDLEGYRAVRKISRVPIAGGEVLTRRQSFRPWLNSGALDIVQPDVTHAGGISEMRHLSTMAAAAGVKLIPHGWNTAIGLAADLQLAAAFPATDLVEYLTGSPYIDGIRDGNWQLDNDGFLPIPDAPGLGVALDAEQLGRYTDDPAAFLAGSER